MKISPKITAFVLILILAACAGNRALPAEQAILPNPDREELWLMDVQTKDSLGGFQNDCAMITYVPFGNNALTSVSIAHWDRQDSIYRFGMQASKHAEWTGKDRWPMVAHIPADSANPEFRWSLGRKSMWMDGMLTNPDSQTVQIRGQFRSTGAFALQQISRSPDVIVMHPMDFHHDQSQDRPGQVAELNIVNLKNVSLLMNPAEDFKAIYWIHLRPKGGEHDYFLLKQQLDGNMTILAHYNETTRSSYPENFRAVVHEPSAWRDLGRKKTYRLGVDVAAGPDTLRIRPMVNDQELQAGRQSFWMGAIRTVNAEGEDEGVCGNMWVFVR